MPIAYTVANASRAATVLLDLRQSLCRVLYFQPSVPNERVDNHNYLFLQSDWPAYIWPENTKPVESDQTIPFAIAQQ